MSQTTNGAIEEIVVDGTAVEEPLAASRALGRSAGAVALAGHAAGERG